jgi:hypothetical protein
MDAAGDTAKRGTRPPAEARETETIDRGDGVMSGHGPAIVVTSVLVAITVVIALVTSRRLRSTSDHYVAGGRLRSRRPLRRATSPPPSWRAPSKASCCSPWSRGLVIATVLAVLASLAIASSGAIAHELYTQVLRRGDVSPRRQL